MFYSLRGNLIHIDDSTAVVECCGVGYKCYISTNTRQELSEKLNSEVFLFTHLCVREDAMDLFGFSSLEELECFKLLTSVSGVGAKVGIGILSSLSSEQIVLAISSENSKILTSAPGVGSKLAQRIILELKDKISSGKYQAASFSVQSVTSSTGNISKAMEALVALGYSQADAIKALAGFSNSLSVEELIKLSLKTLSRRG